MIKKIDSNFMKDKTVLITGGTGSFGNAVLNRLLKSKIRQVRIFSRDEKKQEDMRLNYNNEKIKFYLGDVRDYKSVDNSFDDVDYVFHAAALKQVPSCEYYPIEAINTNIIGSSNVIDAAINKGVKKLVMLSTDKAVYPINVMGQTKALMEKIMIAKSLNRTNLDTTLCATRYGNVLASRGSVIPLFISQIMENKDITLTDGDMTRFLMSLEDSVDLVMDAFRSGKQGDIFVQKSPAASMLSVAIALKEIFKSNSKIKTIGTRHGEKLYETLISREEMIRVKENKNFFKINSDKRGLNYSKYVTSGERKISKMKEYNSHNATRLNPYDLKKLLNNLDFVKEHLKKL